MYTTRVKPHYLSIILCHKTHMCGMHVSAIKIRSLHTGFGHTQLISSQFLQLIIDSTQVIYLHSGTANAKLLSPSIYTCFTHQACIT